MAKRKKNAPDTVAYDELQWQAEQQVRDAMMATPLAKREIKRVRGELKKQRAEVQRNVRSKMDKKPCPKPRK